MGLPGYGPMIAAQPALRAAPLQHCVPSGLTSHFQETRTVALLRPSGWKTGLIQHLLALARIGTTSRSRLLGRSALAAALLSRLPRPTFASFANCSCCSAWVCLSEGYMLLALKYLVGLAVAIGLPAYLIQEIRQRLEDRRIERRRGK